MRQINVRTIPYREGCVLCQKGNAIFHSLLAVILLPKTLFAGEPEVSDDDAGPAGDDSPTLSREIR